MSSTGPKFIRVVLTGISGLNAAFWLSGLVLWLVNGELWALIRLAYPGTGLGITIGIWLKIPRRKRTGAHR